MSKRKHKQKNSKKTGANPAAAEGQQAGKPQGDDAPAHGKPTLGGETVEPRILLSATWITGTDGDETVTGTSGDDCLDGLGGNDVLQGGGGDDILRGGDGNDGMRGGAGFDHVDYTNATGSITVDLTDTTAQNTGAAGDDTFAGIEGFLGSAYDDTVGFKNAGDGDVFFVDGKDGNDTIDIGSWSQADATIGSSSVTVSMGGGQSFRIDFANVETISFSDGDAVPPAVANAAPTADAGSDQTVDEGDTVTLNGAASADAEGDTLTYSWVQTAGPSVTLSDASVAQPTFTAPDIGANTSVTFDLTVSDGTSSTVDSVTVNIGTWIEGDDSANSIRGTVGDDRIRGFGGDDNIGDGGGGRDTILGGAGDDRIVARGGGDTLDGGADHDTVDFSYATGPVVFDLTDTAAQDTGGAGTSTFSNFEGIIGSDYDDTYSISTPEDGQSYVVDGGAGDNTLILKGIDASMVTFGDGTMTVDNGAGTQFQVAYSNVTTIAFADVDATVVTTDIDSPDWSGNAIFIDGAQAFQLSSPTGSIDWSYDIVTDTLSITASDTSPSDSITIADLNGTDLNIGSLRFDTGLGSLTTDVDISSISMTADKITISSVTVAGGAGTIGTFETLDGDIDNPTVINANVGTIALNHNTNAAFTVNGDVSSMTAHDIKQPLTVTGDVASLAIHNSDGTIDVGGTLHSVAANDVKAQLEAGSVGSMAIDGIRNTVVTTGSLGSAAIQKVIGSGTVSVATVSGSFDFVVDSVQYGGNIATPSSFYFDGASDAATYTEIGNTAPTVDAGTDQVVDEGDIVTLTAGGSADADGDALTYTWTQTSGPAVTLSDASSANPTFTAPEGLSNTDLTFVLTISDDKSTDVTDSVTVTVNADNDAPNANAGTDQIREGNSLVTLDAANSSDPEGQGLTYTWVQTGGPAVTLSDAAAAQPTFTLVNPTDTTTLTFDVQVSDGTNTSTDTVTVTATPQHLVAHWDFSGSGQTVTDVTGNGNDGLRGFTPASGTNDPTGASDPERGDVFEFDGNALVTGAGGLDGGNFSVSAWINQDGSGSGWQTIYSAGTAPEAWLGVNASTGVIRLNLGGPTHYVETSTSALTSGSWQHVTGTWDGSDAHIYIDGVDAALTTGGTPHDPGSSTGTIGAYRSSFTTSVYWHGMMDDVRVYDDAIDAAAAIAQAGNVAPTADAGNNQTVDEGDTVTLDATSSSDPEAGALTYTWVQTAGPVVSLSDASAAQPTFTAPEGLSNTDLTFRLQVSDGTRTSIGDDVTITVNADNDAPSANAGANFTASEGDLITLDGSSSSDPEGEGLTYSWTQTAGPTVTLDDATAAQPSFTAPEGLTGTVFAFDLTVSDGTNVSSSDTVSISVDADNDAPTASTGSNLTVTEGDLVTLSGLASADPEGEALTYTWTQTSGPTVVLDDPSAAQPTFTAPDWLANTSIQFELTVSDGLNVSAADSVTVNVNADNDAPTANAGANATVSEGDLVTLNGVASTDPEAQGLTYTWTQVSGPNVTLSDVHAAQPTFTAPEGLANTTIRFQLQVSDGVNTSSADTIDVTVNADNDLPNANAGPDQTVSEGDSVTLSGLSSTDPENQGMTYLWVQTSGPTVVLSDATAAEPTFVAPERLANTAVQFQLQVSDGVNTSSADTITVNINADNDAPTANAGSNATVSEGDLVTLDGIASADPEAQGLTYAWTQVSGPSVTLSDATAAQPTFTAPEGLANTAVQFQLEVSDGVNTSSADTITVTINADNDAPTADAGTDNATSEGEIVTLNATGSSDPEAQGLTYSWVQTSGPTVVLSDATAAQPTFTAPNGVSNTTLQFELQVNDGVNTSSADTVSINIVADNDAPTANAGPSLSVDENQLVTLDGSSSTDPEGQSLTYSWVQTSGPSITLESPTSSTASFTAPDGISNSTVTFDLTVSDGTSSSVSSVDVLINADNDAPNASAGSNQISAEGNQVLLDGSGSSDPEGQGLTYSWQQISGPPVEIVNADSAQASFEIPEALSNSLARFELTVSDGVNQSTDFVNIGMRADNDAPSVDAGPDTTVRAQDEVQLSAQGQDPESQGLRYEWQQIDGPTVELTNGQGGTATFVAPDDADGAVLRFRVGASDGNSTAFDTVTVVVAPNAAPELVTTAQTAVESGALGMVGVGATDADGDDLTYVWTQIDGPVVGMLSNDSPSIQFQTPEVSTDSVVTFRVTVSDGATTSTQDISVAISAVQAAAIAPDVTPEPALAPEAAPTAAENAQDPEPTEPEPTATASEDPDTTASESFSGEEAAAVAASTRATATDPLETAETAATASSTSSAFTRMAEENQETSSNSLGATMASDELSSAVSEDVSASSLASELEEEGASTTTSGFSLSANLLDDADVLVATASSSLLAQPDLILADAGNRVLMQPRLAALPDAGTGDVDIKWEQVSGTPVDSIETDGDKLLATMPEVFVEEDLVFKVEIQQGNQLVTQEVTVQIQPVGMTNRSLSIDDQAVADDRGGDQGQQEGSRGFGKIWGALLAFFSTQTGRKKS